MKKIVLLSLFGCLLASAVKAQNTPAFDGRQMIDVAKVPSWNFASRPAGWYRIAKTSFRGNATFELREDADHSTLRFQVGISYNSNGGASLTITSHSFYGNPTFLKLRLLTLPGSYDSSFLEVYVDPHNNDGNTFNAYLINPMANGDWSLLNWENGSIPSGYQVAEFNVDKLFAVGNVAQGITLAVTRNGNVGIGTATPQAKLDVNGSAIINGSGNTLTLKKANNIPALAFQGINQMAIIEGGDDYLTAYLGGLRRLSILSNGYVGIGTASPSEKLGIYGAVNSAPGVLALETSRNDAAFVEVGSIRAKNADGEVSRIGLLRGSGTYTGAMNFLVRPTNDAELQEAMRINENGNIGMGGLTPLAKLDVRSDYVKNEYGIIAPTALFLSKNAPQAGNGGAIGLGGKTGLATADYAYAYVLGAKENNSNYAGYFAIHTVAGDGNPGEASSGNYERLRVTSTGNVGIGTATPNEKLSVNGKIRAREIKVETANWPDYVFEEGYKVGTLQELESYVKANKHLPEVPSAKEAEANGVELGEMNKLLLKKVEELTLYLIEKDRQIKKLEDRMANLEKQKQ